MKDIPSIPAPVYPCEQSLASHPCWVRYWMHGIATLLLASTCLFGSEIVVDRNAPPGGDGSSEAPFQTIGEALPAVSGGGTIVVRAGVYPEAVEISNGGTAENPLVIKAAPDETVELSGFDPITGWQDEGGGLYSLKSDERVTSLYVGGKRQQVARFPKSDQPWIRVVAADDATGVYELDQMPEIPSDSQGMFVLTFLMKPKVAPMFMVATSNLADRKATLDIEGEQFTPQVGDFVVFCNALEILTESGEWICRPEDDHWKVFFRPENPEDLKRTQTRTRATMVRIRQAGHIHLENLTITGGEQYGVYTSHANHVQIKRCMIFNNGRTIGHGVRLDQTEDVLVESCMIFANHFNGIAIIQGSNITVRGCVVAANDVDGITLSGRANRPDEPLTNVRLENNFVHSHLYLGHPDNTQMYNHVRGVVYDSNAMFVGGQNAMISDTEDLTFEDNLFFGVVARHVILGHKSAHQAKFLNNTFAFSDSALGTDAKDVVINRNIFYQSRLVYESEGVSGDENLFWNAGNSAPVLSSTLPKWQGFDSVAEFSAQHGFESKSLEKDPEFKNVPQQQVVGDFTFLNGGASQLEVLSKDTGKFSAGMTIEINNDGVARKVSEVSGNLVKFAPPLPAVPFRRPIIWIWPDGASMDLDCSTKLPADNGRIGSDVDFAAYQAGDLLGLGKRSLPELSATAQEAMVEVNDFVYPYFLPPIIDSKAADE